MKSELFEQGYNDYLAGKKVTEASGSPAEYINGMLSAEKNTKCRFYQKDWFSSSYLKSSSIPKDLFK